MVALTVPLYHYTSIASFLSIVESKQFYASDIYYMNDALEIAHAANIAETLIEKDASEAILPKEYRAPFMQALYDSQYARVFGVSFSQERDALSQWRGYGGGAGIALCFDANKATRLAEKNSMTLVKCEYDQNNQIRLLKDLISNVSDQLKASPDAASHEMAQRTFMIQFCSLASRIKHPAFREENEWRMLSQVFESVYDGTSPPHGGYRAGKSVIVPFMKVKLDVDYEDDGDKRIDLGFHDILVGPTQSKELPWRSVMNFLTEKKIKYHQITPSNAPYRGSV